MNLAGVPPLETPRRPLTKEDVAALISSYATGGQFSGCTSLICRVATPRAAGPRRRYYLLLLLAALQARRC